MSKKYTVTDRNRIKSITFKYPEIMDSESDLQIKALYSDILNTKKLLYEYRDKVRQYENELKNKEDKFNALSNILDIEFETIEIIDNNTKSNIMIKNYGNDIIGRSTY